MSQLLAEPEVEKLMTLEEFEALPDDGVERWIIRGKLYEAGDGEMTVRNKTHTPTEAAIATALLNWLRTQPIPRGQIASGEVGFRIQTNPVTILAADVAYISHQVVTASHSNSTLFDGVPVLAVEILSPYDRVQNILNKTSEYLTAGTLMIWIVDPYNQTVTIYRNNTPPIMVNNTQKLENLPELPNFSVDVADLFQ